MTRTGLVRVPKCDCSQPSATRPESPTYVGMIVREQQGVDPPHWNAELIEPYASRVTLVEPGVPDRRPRPVSDPRPRSEAGHQSQRRHAGGDRSITPAFQWGGSTPCCSPLSFRPYSGIPDVWLTGWLQSHFGTRTKPSVSSARSRQGADGESRTRLRVDIRSASPTRSCRPRRGSRGREFDRDGVIFEKSGGESHRLRVDHGDVISRLTATASNMPRCSDLGRHPVTMRM